MIQISVTTDRAHLDPVERALLAHGAASVTLRDAADDPVLEPLPGAAPVWPSVIVTGLFSVDADTESLRRILNTVLDNEPQMEIATLAEQDWSQVWKHDCTSLRFGRRLRIRRGDGPESDGPEGDDHEPARSTIDIFLDPGLAFGTGDHPTTALCLKWLDANPPHQRDMIDYGCGSGILALAAIKLGARRVYAVDIDPQALLATRDNAARNGISAQALLTLGPDALPSKPADLLVANIVARPLAELAQNFATRLKPGGRIVLSGLLPEQIDAVTAVYLPWFNFAPAREKNGWGLLAGVRRPNGS